MEMTDQQRAVMDELFRTMTMAYMQKFTSMFRAATSAETDAAIEDWKEAWCEQIGRSRLTLKAVRCGILAVPTRHPEYPPTVGEFVGLCRAFSEPVTALQAPRTSASETSRGAMQKIAEMLGRNWLRPVADRDAIDLGGVRAAD